MLHQQTIRNIHFYASIANILLLLVQVSCYNIFTVNVATATDETLANKIFLFWPKNFYPCILIQYFQTFSIFDFLILKKFINLKSTNFFSMFELLSLIWFSELFCCQILACLVVVMCITSAASRAMPEMVIEQYK